MARSVLQPRGFPPRTSVGKTAGIIDWLSRKGRVKYLRQASGAVRPYFALNATFDEVKAEDYDALLISGGRAPEYIRLNPRLIEMVKHFAKAGKPIAAVCHGAQVLTAADVVKGKKCTAYPAVGPDVKAAGGEWVGVAVDKAVVDGNLVTAPAWPAHPVWLAEFLKVLGTKIQL